MRKGLESSNLIQWNLRVVIRIAVGDVGENMDLGVQKTEAAILFHSILFIASTAKFKKYFQNGLKVITCSITYFVVGS